MTSSPSRPAGGVSVRQVRPGPDDTHEPARDLTWGRVWPASPADHLVDTPSSRRARRLDVAPWASHPTAPGDPARLDRPRRRPRPAPPVFVDDTGRRRRAGRLVAAGLVVAAIAYVAVIGLNLAGVPLFGRLAPPGIDRLARPAGDTGVVSGPAIEAAPLPAPAATDTAAATDTPSSTAPAPGRGAMSSADVTVPPTTAATASTTSTTVHGRATTNTTPTPNSTVPADPPGGGRPDTPPGQG